MKRQIIQSIKSNLLLTIIFLIFAGLFQNVFAKEDPAIEFQATNARAATTTTNTTTQAKDNAATELKSLLSPIATLQGGFQQTIKTEKGNVLQSMSGKLWLKKPAQFRWEILGKEPRLVVADGKKVWDYDKDLEQVTVQKLNKGKTRAPIYFLTGDANSIDKDFSVSRIAAKTGSEHCMQNSNACFQLKPKRKEGAFQWIRIGFKDKVLKEMEMLDQLGQYSQFIFKDVEVNPNIPASTFQFAPPKGVDVLKNE